MAYFKHLRDSKDGDDNITMPGPISFFTGTDGKCETIIKASRKLVLKWRDDDEVNTGKKAKKPVVQRPEETDLKNIEIKVDDQAGAKNDPKEQEL